MKKEYISESTMEEQTANLATAINKFKAVNELYQEQVAALKARVERIEALSRIGQAMPAKTFYLYKEALELTN